MMRDVQMEKINDAIEKICYLYKNKEQLFHQYFPINQTLIINLETKTNLTLQQLLNLTQILKAEKDTLSHLTQLAHKNTKHTQPKPTQLRWPKNIIRLQESLAEQQQEKVAKLKASAKNIEAIIQEIRKEEGRYRSEVKKMVKETKAMLEKIDDYEKDSNKSLTKMIKESKNIDKAESVTFLCQAKKIYFTYLLEMQTIIDRNKLVLQMVKTIVNNEKMVCKTVHQQFKAFLSNRQEIYNKLKADQKVWGSLSVIQEGINENCQKNLESILNESQMEKLKQFVPPQKNNISTILVYLNSQLEAYEQKLKGKGMLKLVCNSMAFKCWGEISLAGGWILTSYTPAEMYLTFDHLIAIFDLEGNLLKKIQASNSKISEVKENNIYLAETIKGFFSDSVSEYQIKFEDYDRMEEFQLFIENQIQ